MENLDFIEDFKSERDGEIRDIANIQNTQAGFVESRGNIFGDCMPCMLPKESEMAEFLPASNCCVPTQQSTDFFASCVTKNFGCIPSICIPAENERMIVNLQADQPVINVPLYQDILRRDKYIEVPKIELYDTYIPRVYAQNAIHEVPKMDVSYVDKHVNLESYKYVDKPVEVPVHVGYKPILKPKWDVRQVPRPIPKYEGEQQIIEVPVPQIEYVDKYVEKEVVVDVKEKIVPKPVEIERETEVIKYEWKKMHHDVPLLKYVPKFDVELECPPPLIVPFPETKIVKDSPVYVNSSCNTDSYCSDFLSGKNGKFNEDNNIMYSSGKAPSNSSIKYSASLQINSNDLINSVTQQQLVDKEEHDEADNENKSWWKLWPFKKENFYCCKNKQDKSSEVKNTFPYTGNLMNILSKFDDNFIQGVDSLDVQKMKLRNSETAEYLSPNDTSKDQLIVSPISPPSGCDLEPTVEYKGAINKPPRFAGNLEPISFKLHAIEVHQFIPLPNVDTPEFIKMMPYNKLDTVSDGVGEIGKIFGPVPAGWADPAITGMPAPMMNDIIRGNLQCNSPLFQHISMAGPEAIKCDKSESICGNEFEKDHISQNSFKKEMSFTMLETAS